MERQRQMLKDLSVIIVTLISEHLRRKSHCTRIRIYKICFPMKSTVLWSLL